ncbi:LolA-like outer membrane lipoprotein chaperone [Campylobacter sp. 19-13652]|uniref:LolA-like outer membrane lipoprotein chaperone n=1 Tax=Campylobacter sp. 19-13652 TaxID=2840180 RepID=UPI001C799246|nr:LolA-like outer membrane lipoprotein chaperone [Campylobacter sp. 19-13652]BCX79322.1 hypothetical protein LBC_07840 [Campylobacter sp. 19-13652]
MKKFILIFLCVTSLFAASALEFGSLSADFVQTIKSGGKDIVYNGRFYATTKEAFWEYDSPARKRIYFSDDRVVIIEDELEQAIISRLENVPNLTSILRNAKRISDKLYKASYDDVDYLISIDERGVVSMIDYKDKLDNKVKITLSNVIKNGKINPEIFIPHIPQGYDIISR